MDYINMTGFSANPINEYIADAKCLNWCVVQHVINYSNLETYTIIFPTLSLILILCAEYSYYKQKIDIGNKFVYFAKISLYVFFFMYFMVLKLRLYYYITGG